MKKIFFTIIAIIIIAVLYLYFSPKIIVKVLPLDKKMPTLVFPLRDYENNKDSVLVYIPYKIRVTNYSNIILKGPNYYFRAKKYEHHPYELMFDKNGVNVDFRNYNLSTISSELLKFGKVYPIIPRNFYVYKYNVIAAKRINLNIDSTNYRNLEKEFVEMKENLKNKSSITIPQNIIDSLYYVENKKPFYLNFRSKPGWRTKTFPLRGKSEFENIYKLSREEMLKRTMQQIE